MNAFMEKIGNNRPALIAFLGGQRYTGLLANGINHPEEKMHWIFAVELCRTLFEVNK